MDPPSRVLGLRSGAQHSRKPPANLAYADAYCLALAFSARSLRMGKREPPAKRALTLQSYPHIHSREQKKKKQKEKCYYGGFFYILIAYSGSYKVAGPNPVPATPSYRSVKLA